MKHLPASSFINEQVGNIRLTKVLGEGGMGQVFLGEHINLGTLFAVKLLHPELTAEEQTVERFRREAMVCSKLRHPNIVFLTDFGTHETLGLYIVMEYLDGLSLNDWLQQNPIPSLWHTITIAQQICDALAVTHGVDVIHRDLKPDNIFVQFGETRPHIKLLDFGIARMGHRAMSQLTPTGMLLGTPEYISPEMIQGKKNLGASVDIYAMGILLYEMLTGKTPFSAEDPIVVLTRHMRETATPLEQIRPELTSTRLAQLVQSMMEKEPERRPNSMEEIRDELAEALQELQERATTGSQPPKEPEQLDSQAAPKKTPMRTQGVSSQPGFLLGKETLTQFANYLKFVAQLQPNEWPGRWLQPLTRLQDSSSTAFVAAHGQSLWGWLQAQSEPRADMPIVVEALALLLEDALQQVVSPTPDPFVRRWVTQMVPQQFGSLQPSVQNVLRMGFLHLKDRPMFPYLPEVMEQAHSKPALAGRTLPNLPVQSSTDE